MSSRRTALAAVAAATAVLALAACGPDDGSGTGAAPAGSSAARPSGVNSATAQPAATGSAGAQPSTGAGGACATPKPDGNHRVIHPVRQPRQDTVTYQETGYTCAANGGRWEPTGPQQNLVFAPQVKAQLQPASGQYRTVVVGELWNHIGACLDHAPDAGVCGSGLNYEIALDGEGRINEIRELYAS
ncbi:hypothetical protein [Kitasatospora purpeofusca]|uniref:hypothetical protein n=1 Tax=Kitasatospora purpeofusca TaxID=67352 RepID=UPI002A59F6AC|nr:hypothetical protein [Kitasatospora purpeofusca]MDY0814485.1 hypothetical protein [Kitasatospora purpeofusca]